VVPLVAERLTCDVATLCDSVANVLIESGYVVRKLDGDACNELSRVANVSTASREEEAGPETRFMEIVASDSPRNRGLARASQTIQPEETPLVLTVSPVKYLSKEVDAGIREANGLMLVRKRVEARFDGVRQAI
jgi:hypothetical protein